jgi:AAHS family 4-hydroxybenzoate transporter-like MFS transporter
MACCRWLREKWGVVMSEHLASVVDTAIKDRAFGRFQLRVTAMCFLVTAFDGYDLSSAGFATPALSDAWQLPPQAFTPALVAGSIGLFCGALASGPMGDRIGRKVSLVSAILIFGMFSLLSAASGSLPALVAMRFITGLGLGAAIPLTVALVSDYTPRARHAAVVATMATGFSVGALVGGVVASRIVHDFGWQSIFIIGGLAPLVYVPIMIMWLPESVQFLVLRDGFSGRARALLRHMNIEPKEADIGPAAPAGAAQKNPVVLLFSDGFSTRTILLWIVFAMHFLTTYLLTSWLPSLFHAEGMSTADSIFATTMFQPGAIVGGLVIGWLCDRFGAERTLVVTVAIGASFIVALGLVAVPFIGTLVLIVGIGVGIGGSQQSMNALAGAVYPPQFRSTGTGWALGIGRLGNIFGPFIGGVMLSFGLPPTLIIMVAAVPAIFVITALVLLGIVRRRAASPLPQLGAASMPAQ